MMKRIFIIVAIAVVIAAGVTLYLNNIQTPEPTVKAQQVELPVVPEPEVPKTLPVVAPKPVEVSPPAVTPEPVEVPPLPEPEPEPEPEPVVLDFIVDDEHWQNAFMLRSADGSKWMPGVGFSQIPVGTIIYAPISGYLNAATAIWGEQKGVSQMISIDGIGIDPPYFQVVGANLEILTPSGKYRVEKGEPWIKVVDSQEIAIGRFDRQVVLMVTAVPRDQNMGVIDETTDPRGFLWVLTQKIVGEDK